MTPAALPVTCHWCGVTDGHTATCVGVEAAVAYTTLTNDDWVLVELPPRRHRLWQLVDLLRWLWRAKVWWSMREEEAAVAAPGLNPEYPRVGLVRVAVISRDDGCVARRVDSGAGACRDRWGDEVYRLSNDQLEMDYVKLGATGRHHQLPGDHVALCPGHHRGIGAQAGHVWATSHRLELRRYLQDVG